jgi:hypothetical protein
MAFLISNSKYGDCSVCGDKDTAVRKRGKNLLCLNCCKIEDNKKQVQKANERNKIRGLWGKQVEEGKEDLASRANLSLDLDFLASRIVRLRAAGENGMVSCYCCDRAIHWSMADCSHFISRKCLGLRWDLVYNLKQSCKNCNQNLYGNLEVFAQRLELEHPGIVEILKEREREVYKPDLQEMKQMLIDFRAKLKPLEAKFSKPIINQ